MTPQNPGYVRREISRQSTKPGNIFQGPEELSAQPGYFTGEAIYQGGINRYRKTNEPGDPIAAAELLQKKYPCGGWAKKAAPYRFITGHRKA